MNGILISYCRFQISERRSIPSRNFQYTLYICFGGYASKEMGLLHLLCQRVFRSDITQCCMVRQQTGFKSWN